MTSRLANIEEMIAPQSLWREARAILLRHAEEDRLSTPVLPGLHLMRFGWSSLPVVGMQSPCITLVIQGAKSLDFGPTHLEYGAGKYLLTPIDMPVTCRIVSATSKNPLLAVAIEIDFEELKQLVHRCDTLPSSSPQPGIKVFETDSDLLEAVVRLLRLLDTPDGGIRWYGA
jgi:hypothetical protein